MEKNKPNKNHDAPHEKGAMEEMFHAINSLAKEPRCVRIRDRIVNVAEVAVLELHREPDFWISIVLKGNIQLPPLECTPEEFETFAAHFTK